MVYGCLSGMHGSFIYDMSDIVDEWEYLCLEKIKKKCGNAMGKIGPDLKFWNG